MNPTIRLLAALAVGGLFLKRIIGGRPLDKQPYSKHHATDYQQTYPVKTQIIAAMPFSEASEKRPSSNQNHANWQRPTRSALDIAHHIAVILGTIIAVVGLLLLNSNIRQQAEASRLEQRAFIYIPYVAIVSEPTTDDPNAVITVGIVNRGQTPAHSLINRVVVSFEATKPDLTRRQASAPAVVPPNIEGLSITAMVVDDFISPEQRKRVPALAAEYIAGTRRMYVWARFDYRDWFDTPHWINVCAYRVHGMDSNTFTYCESGNDFDRNK